MAPKIKSKKAALAVFCTAVPVALCWLATAVADVPEGDDAAQSEQPLWSDRVDTLLERKLRFEAQNEEVDRLYGELEIQLRTRLDHLHAALDRAVSPFESVPPVPGAPASVKNIVDLHNNVQDVYRQRLRLIEQISPLLYLEVTATGVVGTEALGLELAYIWSQFRYEALYVPSAIADWWRRIQIAPLPIVWSMLELLLVFALFVWWRRWFPETLRRTRASLLEIRPRTSAVLRRVKLLWYIGQVRRPVEWLIFFHALFSLAEIRGLSLINNSVATIVRWILLGWFSVSLLDAIAARADAGLTGDTARLRLNSLRLVAAWLVLLGLGLALAGNLAGVATLHAWVWRLMQILALPVIVVLLAWWRPAIFARLAVEQESSETAQQMLRHTTGLRSYLAAASGAIWLLANRLRRSLMRAFLRFGAQQGLTSGATGSSSESPGSVVSGATCEPLPTELHDRIMQCGDYVERYARPERRELVERARRQQGGIVAVAGDRGRGKTCVLQQLANSLPDHMLLVDCLGDDYAELEQALVSAIGTTSANPKRLSKKLEDREIQVVAIDNLHRLVRPVMEGQAAMTQLMELLENISLPILWLATVDTFAWQFMRRVRADRTSVSEVITLQPWTEEQMTELFELRNKECDIAPNFSDVQIPREYRESTLDAAEARNKAGVYRMIWDLSGGNPGVALRIWAASLRVAESGKILIQTPQQPPGREVDKAPLNVLLVLRAIAMSEQITRQDLVDNLRLPHGAVGSALHYAETRGWLEHTERDFRLSWDWYSTITRVLARQNLLAR